MSLVLATCARAAAPVHHVTSIRNPQVLFVLDRSGSLTGMPFADEKTAATTLANFFTATSDSLELETFATSVSMGRLGESVASVVTGIQNMNAAGWSTLEAALDQAAGPNGLPDQSALAPEDRAPQYLILFTDGVPTGFRGSFLYQGVAYDGVVGASCDDPTNGYPLDNELWSPTHEGAIALRSIYPTGDGLLASACGTSNTVRWFVLDTNPVPGYASTACGIPGPLTGLGIVGPLAAHVCDLAHQLALDHAATLKNRGVRIFTVRVGQAGAALSAQIRDLLAQIASSPGDYYEWNGSANLLPIFQAIQGATTATRGPSWGRLQQIYR